LKIKFKLDLTGPSRNARLFLMKKYQITFTPPNACLAKNTVNFLRGANMVAQLTGGYINITYCNKRHLFFYTNLSHVFISDLKAELSNYSIGLFELNDSGEPIKPE
jgi:hypothetical protein